MTSISLGQVVSSSATSTAYRVNVPTAVPFLVAALQSNPISTTTLPQVTIHCPTGSGGTNLLSSLQSRAMLTCIPQFSSGDSGDVQVGMEHTTSALLFALRTDQGTTATFSGLNLGGVPLGANTAQLYQIENTSTNVKQRNLVFSAGVSDSVAMLYREDGTLICSSLSSDVCQVYDSDWSNYYLVVVNASTTDTTYDIRFDG